MTPDPTTKRPAETTNAPLPSAVSGRRLWLFRLAAILVAPLLLILLEVGLRLADYGYPTGFYVKAGSAGINMTNYRFGWRFFPPSIARSPEPHLLSARVPGRFGSSFLESRLHKACRIPDSTSAGSWK